MGLAGNQSAAGSIIFTACRIMQSLIIGVIALLGCFYFISKWYLKQNMMCVSNRNTRDDVCIK